MGKLTSDVEDDLAYIRSLLTWADTAALLPSAVLVIALVLAWWLR